MFVLRHLPVRLAFLACFAASALLRPAHAPAQMLSADLVRLLPADPIAVVVVPSIDEFTRDIRRVIELFDDEAAAGFDPLTMLGGTLAALSDVIDPARPAVLAVRLAPGAPMPLMVGVLPLNDPALSDEQFRARVGMEALALEAGHVVVGNDSYYRPGGRHPALLHNLPATDIAARLDLRAVFEHFGPMLDAIISMALATPQGREPSDEAHTSPRSGPESEDIDRALEWVDLIRDGVRTIELALDVQGSRVEMHLGVDLDPEGPLALADQPSKEAALDLLRALPRAPGTAGYAAGALDLSPMNALLEGAMRLGDLVVTADSANGPDQAFFDQFTSVIGDLYALYWEPHAWVFGNAEEGSFAHGLVNASDPIGLVGSLFEAMHSLKTTGFGVELAGEYRVGDLQVQRYRFDYDLRTSMSAVDAALDTASLEAIDAWMRAAIPDLEVATLPGRVLLSTAHGEQSRIEALALSSSRPGELPEEMREVIAWAGPQARGWLWVDLTTALAMVADILDTMPQDGDFEMPSAEELTRMPAMPLAAAVTLEASWLRSRLGMDLQAVASFAEIIRAMEN